MSNKDSLGDRMKGYERVTKQALIRRTPVIIRVDGKAFHTFTRRLNEHNDPSTLTGPSEKFHSVMLRTMLGAFEDMQNCVFAYTQSDEMSFLLRDWDKHETEQWFDGNIQKLASVSASLVTAHFAQKWYNTFEDIPGAMFDSRVFNVPHDEVVNYFIWRQQDAMRNSVQFIARKYFSHKELHGKNNSEIQEMLWRQHGINWNHCGVWKKRGSCIYRGDTSDTVDEIIPIFTKDRDYIGRHLEIIDE